VGLANGAGLGLGLLFAGPSGGEELDFQGGGDADKDKDDVFSSIKVASFVSGSGSGSTSVREDSFTCSLTLNAFAFGRTTFFPFSLAAPFSSLPSFPFVAGRSLAFPLPFCLRLFGLLGGSGTDVDS
jgi:hypothetical protein